VSYDFITDFHKLPLTVITSLSRKRLSGKRPSGKRPVRETSYSGNVLSRKVPVRETAVNRVCV